MKQVTFIVEKTGSGYSAYAKDYPVYTVGDNMEDLKKSMLDAINTHFEDERKTFKLEDIRVRVDLPSLFEYYKEINAANLSRRIGMNRALLAQYINGIKTPSEKQVTRIMEGIKSLGRELSRLEIA
jgi:hypothetical protein